MPGHGGFVLALLRIIHRWQLYTKAFGALLHHLLVSTSICLALLFRLQAQQVQFVVGTLLACHQMPSVDGFALCRVVLIGRGGQGQGERQYEGAQGENFVYHGPNHTVEANTGKMMSSLQDLRTKISDLEQALEQLLEVSADGLSEHALLSALRQRDELAWLGGDHSQHYNLFQRHFLLFHALYLMQQRDWAERHAYLEISPLHIQRHPYRSGEAGLDAVDPLRSYYLDLDNLVTTSAEDVKQMLNGFWQRYLAGEGREEALQLLGLEEPVDRQVIERRYRELAAQHHPDRGGDAQRQVEINKAIGILRQYYID
jgi:DnaJ-domain-containing protein 1